VRRLRIGGLLPVGHGGEGIGHTGIPEQPALSMLEQIAIIHEGHGLPDVDAGRPARDIPSDALAAIEDVEPLQTRGLGRPGREGAEHGDDHSGQQWET
jgi:hypothetical protein